VQIFLPTNDGSGAAIPISMSAPLQRHGWQRIAIIERKTDGPVSEKYRRAQGQ
jgi:hypothetical protein